MIFTGFKRKSNQIFLNKRLNNLFENPHKDFSERVKNLLVFLDDISEMNVVKKELSEMLFISEENIEILVSQNKINKGEVLKSIFSSKDFGWFGQVRSDFLKDVLTKKYDLLINYSKVDNIYSNLLLLQCECGFRIGLAHLDRKLYDLIIDCKPEDKMLYNSEIKKYLEILKKI